MVAYAATKNCKFFVNGRDFATEGPLPPKSGPGVGHDLWSIDARFYISVNFRGRNPRPPKGDTPGLPPPTTTITGGRQGHPPGRPPPPPRRRGPCPRRPGPGAAGVLRSGDSFRDRRPTNPAARMIAGFFHRLAFHFATSLQHIKRKSPVLATWMRCLVVTWSTAAATRSSRCASYTHPGVPRPINSPPLPARPGKVDRPPPITVYPTDLVGI